jgi:transcriptional regulator with XRE-family HTH domain
MSRAGARLRTLRETLGLTMRDVETRTEQLAREHGSVGYFVPVSRLSDIETKGITPSIYRLHALATIYKINARDILSLYDVNLDSVNAGTENSTVAGLKTNPKQVAPPIAGCYLLDLLLPRKHRDNLVGDIEEDYRTTILPKYGRTAASIWFWKQVLVEAVPGLYLRIVTSFLKRYLGA